jgi:D-beta-D-heptose 7-phosphate kinase/D-beta-D-heptose 1-phosphate adenosyltransferase
VYDVTGAGDTVAGTLALALASGSPLEAACRLASAAAAVVVGKRGTATVCLDELHAAAGHPARHAA